MAAVTTTRTIIDNMRRVIPGRPTAQAVTQPTPCTGFSVDDFGVEYPNQELMATAQISGVPSGVTLVGVTIGASPSMTSPDTYCMAVAAENAGLALPVTLLAATTSAAISGPTTVTGFIVLAYRLGSSPVQECVITQQFTVGG